MSLRDGEFGYHELERSALAFVLEDHTWPAFILWATVQHASAESHDWLAAGPSLDEARKLWTEHSPDPAIRALAERMPG